MGEVVGWENRVGGDRWGRNWGRGGRSCGRKVEDGVNCGGFEVIAVGGGSAVDVIVLVARIVVAIAVVASSVNYSS